MSYLFTHIYMYLLRYIYIYRERERDRESIHTESPAARGAAGSGCNARVEMAREANVEYACIYKYIPTNILCIYYMFS